MDGSLNHELAQPLDVLLANGYFNRVVGIKTLQFEYGEREPPISPERKTVIEGRWAEIVSKNPNAFSTEFLCLNGFAFNALTQALTLGTYLSNFKEYITTKKDELGTHRIWCLGACGLTYIIENGERTFIFGERTPKTLDVGGYIESLPGGFVKPASRLSNPVQITLLDELEEETGIPCQHVQYSSPFSFGMLRTWKGNQYQDTNVNYTIELQGLDRDQVLGLFQSQNQKKIGQGKLLEHTKIDLIRESNLQEFIRSFAKRMGVRTLFTLESYLSLSGQLPR